MAGTRRNQHFKVVSLLPSLKHASPVPLNIFLYLLVIQTNLTYKLSKLADFQLIFFIRFFVFI